MPKKTQIDGVSNIPTTRQQVKKRLDDIEDDFFSSINDEYPTVKRKRKGGRSEEINWSLIRQDFVKGKLIQLEDGTYLSEDYSHKELADKYNCGLSTIKAKASKEEWTKWRRLYLARVSHTDASQDLGAYVQENYHAEANALNAITKLSVVANTYIENKFSDILDSNEDVTQDGSNIDILGVDIVELKEAVKVINDIYSLQRKIYDNRPKTDIDTIDDAINAKKNKAPMNPRDREAKIKQLQARLGKNLSIIEGGAS